MSFQHNSPDSGGGNRLIWAIQGAIDDIDPGTGEFTIPLSSMITGYSTTLVETDPYSWRSTDTLIVPVGRAEWYLISFGVYHPTDAIGGGVQEALNDFNVGVEIEGRIQKFSADSNVGLPEVGAFSLPAYLEDSDTIKFKINADVSQLNEDFLVRASIMSLRS